MLLDFEHLTSTDGAGVTMNVGSDSLVIVDSLARLDSSFGTFTGTARTHIAGSGDLTYGTVADPAHLGMTGWGDIDDKVVMALGAGTLQATDRGWLNFNAGLEMIDGVVDVGSGTIAGITQSGGEVTAGILIVDHLEGITPSDISGGVLNVGTLKVATIGTGLFTQTGGDVNVTGTATLTLGESAGSTGTYLLSSGTLTQSGAAVVGGAGTGVLIQTGGVHTFAATDLFIGGEATGVGEYIISDGDLVGGSGGHHIHVGSNGDGTLTQTGGTVTTGQFRIAEFAGSTGTLTVTGGLLDLSSSGVLGNSGSGYMSYTGGEVNIAGNLHIGYGNLAGGFGYGELIITDTTLDVLGTGSGITVGDRGSVGKVVQTNATVNASLLVVGDEAGGSGSYVLNSGLIQLADVNNVFDVGGRGGASDGVFLHLGGTVSAPGAAADLRVGNAAGSTGEYRMTGSDAYLNIGDDVRIGNTGDGAFIHATGTFVVGSTFYVGSGAGSAGSYEITDGLLQIANNLRLGNNGVGVFTQTGGTVLQLANTLHIAYGTGSEGTYSISDGLLDINQLRVGRNGTGIFNQSGGSVNVRGNAMLDANNAAGTGVVNVSDGTMTIGLFLRLEDVANGTGVFNQTGGSVEVSDDLDLAVSAGGVATYNMDGGSLIVGANMDVQNAGATGVYNQTAGTARFGGNLDMDVGTVIVNLSGGLLDVAGNLTPGAGTYNQTGGVADFGGTVSLNNVLTFEQSDGLLEAEYMIIGDGTPFTFTPTGGSLQVNEDLIIGSGAGGDGTYNVAGGAPLSPEADHHRVRRRVRPAELDQRRARGRDHPGQYERPAGRHGRDERPDRRHSGSARRHGRPRRERARCHRRKDDARQDHGQFAGRWFRRDVHAYGRRGPVVDLQHHGGRRRGRTPWATSSVPAPSSKAPTPANLTVNPGGVFIGWTDKAGNGGIDMTGALTNDGQVIANGFGIPAGTISLPDRTLDLTSFSTVTNGVTNGGAGTAGWYARNQGTLALPPVAISGAGTYNWGEPQAATTPDLVNSLQLTFTSVTSGFNAEISLLSNDDPDVIADMNDFGTVNWDTLGVQFIGVWLIQDDKDGLDDFDALPWSVKFRYDEALLNELLATDPKLSLGGYDESDLRVYYYDEVLGDWVMLNVDITQELDAANNLIWIPDDAGRGEGMYAIVIPEPGTMALLAMGGIGMLVRRRRRRTA